MAIAFLTLIMLGLGLATGHHLAQRGVTADSALRHHQRQVYLWGSIALVILLGFVFLMVYGKRSPWIPTVVLLYTGAYWSHAILLLCAGLTGFVVGLEKSGWRDRQRLQQLGLFAVVGCSAMAFLWHQQLPITNLVDEPKIRDGVVMQTTPYSCAAAAIATLVRHIDPQSTITEADVVRLAGTSRQGTSVLGELRAMKELGLQPEFHRRLTIDDLRNRQQLAVLHVLEAMGGRAVGHAIALLDAGPSPSLSPSLNPSTSDLTPDLAASPARPAALDFLTVGNPIYGIQFKTPEDMEDYWLNEAVFVTIAP